MFATWDETTNVDRGMPTFNGDFLAVASRAQIVNISSTTRPWDEGQQGSCAGFGSHALGRVVCRTCYEPTREGNRYEGAKLDRARSVGKRCTRPKGAWVRLASTIPRVKREIYIHIGGRERERERDFCFKIL